MNCHLCEVIHGCDGHVDSSKSNETLYLIFFTTADHYIQASVKRQRFRYGAQALASKRNM